MGVTLFGYRYSVYTRAVRLALQEKGVVYELQDVNPFDDPPETNPHPFHHVPLLRHDGFDLFETRAILRYVDQCFDGPALTPAEPRACARMDQVISIMDSYGYWPMVRQVFVHLVLNQTPDNRQADDGLAASRPVLDALDTIAAEGLVLVPGAMTLADCHLAPMMECFTLAPDGAAMLTTRPALARWWDAMRTQPSVIDTDPKYLAALAEGRAP